MTKEELIQKYTRADGRWNSALLRRIPIEDLNLLTTLTPQFKDTEPNLSVRLHILKHGIESVSCPVCNKIQTKLNDRGEIGTVCRQCFDKSPLKKESMKSRNYEEAKKKRSATMLSKYGVEFNSQREDVKSILKKSKLSEEKYTLISNLDLLIDLHHNQKLTAVQIGNRLGIYYGTIIDWIRKNDIEFKNHKNQSQYEDSIESILKEFHIKFDKNTRKVIAPKELDFYIPSHSLAIEVNGVYWHSELNGRGPNYHLQKLEECESRGVRLLQFWDSEIEFQFPIIESMIKARLGISRKIMGRKCSIVTPTKKQEQEFFIKNHRQGYAPSNLAVALEHEGELLSMMSFSKPRFNKDYDWELLRFASKLGITVTGAASKLFNRSPKGSMISYADRRYSSGNVYSMLGFTQKSVSGPGFWYTKDHRQLFHRTKFQKHKLKNILERFDTSLSEWENMQLNGYDRVWDCGQSVWVLER